MALLIQEQTLLEYLPDPDETALRIPETVRYIGDRAFRHPNVLREITLPDGLCGIGILAFAGCRRLERIEIPAGVLNVPVNAFLQCDALREIAVAPDSPMYRSEGGILYTKDGRTLVCCPSGLPSKGNVTVPEGVAEIGDYAFSDCRFLHTVILPDTVRFIGKGAFSGCDLLRWVDMSGSVTSIGQYAFKDTRWMRADADGFVTAGFVLVEYRGKAKDVTVPDGIRVIGKRAFAGKDIVSVTLPESVVRIDNEAFSGCTELTCLHIPKSVHRVGYRAFYDTPWFGEQREDFIVCGDGVLIGYRGAEETVCIPNGIRCIGGGVFEQDASRYAEYPRRPGVPHDDLYGDTDLAEPLPDYPPPITSVFIPDGVTRIETRAFDMCLSLQTVRLPEGLTYLGTGAFSGPMLQDVTVPESVRFIGRECFDSGSRVTFRRRGHEAVFQLEQPWGGTWGGFDDETFLDIFLLHPDPAVRRAAFGLLRSEEYRRAAESMLES